MVNRGDMMNIDDILDILAIDLIGIVPDDEAIVISTNKGEPVIIEGKSMSGQAYSNISKRIAGEDIPLLNLDVEESLITRIRKMFFGK